MAFVLASDVGLAAPFLVLVLVVTGVVVASPFTAVVNWLKGKKVASMAMALVAAISGLTWLTNERHFLIELVVALASPFALLGVIAALRAAKPGSWWFRRYPPGKQEVARAGFTTPEGRRRRMVRSAVVLASVAGGLALSALVATGIEDLLTTSYDELYTGVTLYIDDPDGSVAAGVVDRIEGSVVEITVEAPTAVLGDDARQLWASPNKGCFIWRSSTRIHMTIAPPEHEAVNQVLRALPQVEGLIGVESRLGDPESILGVAPMFRDDHGEVFTCAAAEVLAVLKTDASEDERRRLADRARTLDGVLAVEQPIWPPNQLGYAQFPALVECFGPKEMAVWVEESQTHLIPSVIEQLEAESIVRVAGSFHAEEEYDGRLDEALYDHQSSECERLHIPISLAGDIADSEAASVVAGLRLLPGVVDVDLYLPSEQDCSESSDCEGAAYVLVGDTGGSTLKAIGEAVCGKPGVLGLDTWWDPDASPCPRLWLEVRVASKSAVEAAFAIVETSRSVYDASTLEPDEGLVPETVVGTRNPDLCDEESSHLWRLHVQLLPVDEDEVSSLVSRLEALEGFRAIAGSAVGAPERDPEKCGMGALWYYLLPRASAQERQAVIALLSSDAVVFAADLLENRDHVGTENGSVDIGWSGTIYFMSFDDDAARSLKSRLDSLSGVAYVEVIEHYEEFVP